MKCSNVHIPTDNVSPIKVPFYCSSIESGMKTIDIEAVLQSSRNSQIEFKRIFQLQIIQSEDVKEDQIQIHDVTPSTDTNQPNDTKVENDIKNETIEQKETQQNPVDKSDKPNLDISITFGINDIITVGKNTSLPVSVDNKEKHSIRLESVTDSEAPYTITFSKRPISSRTKCSVN